MRDRPAEYAFVTPVPRGTTVLSPSLPLTVRICAMAKSARPFRHQRVGSPRHSGEHQQQRAQH